MRDASRARAAVRLGLLVLALAVPAGGGWWLADRVSRRSDSGKPADPAAHPSVRERLGDVLRPENAPTTEADPPQAKDGESWGRAAGLHQSPDPLRLKASAVFVTDRRTGEVLLDKNADAVLPIASLAKLMTALVVTEAKLPLDEAITIGEEDVDRERNSRSRLRIGTTLTRGEALRLALMSSENRAAHALGRSFPGGVDAFVRAMNRKAQALGLKKTVYADPTGLSNRNRSTARELAIVTAAAAKVPLIREYSVTPQHLAVLGDRVLRYNNSDRLVNNPRWDIHLQKTGYIVEAGQCLVLNASMAGRDLILVLLDSADKHSRIADAERIRQWATGEPAEQPVRQAVARKVKKLKDTVQARRDRRAAQSKIEKVSLRRHAKERRQEKGKKK